MTFAKKLSFVFSLVLAFCLCLFSFSGCEFGEKKVTELSNASLLKVNGKSYVKWEGRYEYKAEKNADAMVYLYFTATGFTVDFVGTELDVTFWSDVSNKPYYNFALDDEELPNANEDRRFKLNGDEETITLVKDLENTRHTLKCLKMSEAADAITAVKTLKTDGYFVARDVFDDDASLKFMFVCASGGSGHGSLYYNNSNTGAGRTTKNSSSLHAFNYLTARMFDADVQFVAQSGWGVKYPKSISQVLDYSGITKSNSVSGAKTTAQWDYDLWEPDVIIFNIGGNDTTASGFDKTTYQNEVVAMVEKLHTIYPSAKMIWTHTNSNAGKYAMSAISDEHLTYVKECIIPKVGDGPQPDPEHLVTYGYGANNHNSLKTHIATAQILADFLHNTWRYTSVKQNVTFNDFASMIVS